MARILILISFLVLAAATASAAPRTAVFPFELSVPPLHPDDLMFGMEIKPEETERLDIVTRELRSLLAKSGKYDVADLSGIADEIKSAAPLTDCNGCERDLAMKVHADLAVLPLLEKASDTLLNMTIAVEDVASGALLKRETVVIRGNTEEAWLRAVRWLVERRLAVEKETDH